MKAGLQTVAYSQFYNVGYHGENNLATQMIVNILLKPQQPAYSAGSDITFISWVQYYG